jgi:hypothetical protein
MIRRAEAGEVFRGVALAPEGDDKQESLDGTTHLAWCPWIQVYPLQISRSVVLLDDQVVVD